MIQKTFLFSIFILSFTSALAEAKDFDVKLTSLEAKSPSFEQIDQRSMEIHFGFQKEDVNFKLLVQNQIPESKTYYLSFLWSHLDEVDVCLENGICSQAGYSHPVSTWPIAQIFPVFPIQISPGVDSVLSIRIHSKNFIESEIQILTTEELFYLISWQTGLVFSFLIMISFFLIRLAYHTFNHPRPWMFYNLAFHLCIALVFVFASGIANCYLFPGHAISLSHFKKIILGILIITGCGWLSNYLETKTHFPKVHKFYQGTVFLSSCLLLLSFTEFPRLYISIGFTFIYVGMTLLFIALAISRSKDQLKPSPWLLLSLLCLLFFEMLNIFSYQSFDSHDIKIYLFFLSIFLPANSFFVSRTIRDRISDIQAELTLSKTELQKFKLDLNQSLNNPDNNSKKSYLNGVDTDKILSRLKDLMTNEKLFLEEELRLADLSAHLGLSVHQTSEILNQIMNTSFTDLLKHYRVEEAKRMLIENKEKTILEIALDCGFQSKSVFNESFKKNISLTPVEYRKKHGK
jgi:AraC-like DNA-binding protein